MAKKTKATTKRGSKSSLTTTKRSAKSSASAHGMGDFAAKPIAKVANWMKSLSPEEKKLIVKGLIFLVPLVIPSVRSKFPKMVRGLMKMTA